MSIQKIIFNMVQFCWILFLLIGVCVQTSFCSSKSPPHIIMIIADDLGFNDVSFHGSKQIPTPNIDQLANDGVILNNYYVLPSCTPTRSAIMTGRYPIHTGMQSDTIYGGSPWALGLEEKLLPEYLKSVGYTAHAIGKWHLGFYNESFTPTHRGFDTFYGYYGGQADYWDHSLESSGFWGLDLHKDTPTSSETVWNQWGNYSSKMYAMEAIDRINHHDSSKPLFLYLAFQAVHSANRVQDALQAPLNWVNKFNHIKHKGRRKVAAMVAYMDYSIGLVIDALKEQGMMDNSIIIFSSDNGGPANYLDFNWATNYPLRGGKTNTYEGGVRAAGCIYSKLIKTKPRVSRDMMHASDWLPTLLDAAGYDHTNLTKLDGMSMWKTLTEAEPSRRQEILINIDPLLYKNSALRIGDWKLVNQNRFFDGWYPPPQVYHSHNNTDESHEETHPKIKFTPESSADIKCGPKPSIITHCGGKGYSTCLFNLKEDPCEYRDVSKKYPIIFKLMKKRLEEYRKNMTKPRRDTHTDPKANPKLHGGVWLPWKKV